MAGKKYRQVLSVDDRVLVSENIEIELELRVIAALVAYMIGAKSMDRLLKDHGEVWRKQLEEDSDVSL